MPRGEHNNKRSYPRRNQGTDQAYDRRYRHEDGDQYQLPGERHLGRELSESEYERRSQKPPRQHKQNFIARAVNNWFDRVVGAMRGEGLSAAEEQYASHKTTRDFVWNTLGSASWAAVFPVVTMVSTQLIGVEQAGMVSMAFVVALLLMFIGNFGVRTYQISDIDRQHSFLDYQINRLTTCLIMLFVGWLYCSLRGYSTEMYDISMAVIAYRFIDALADVYEGRLQQVDKLYLAGISQTIRSVSALVVFSAALFITHSAFIACVSMAIAAAITFVVITWPLALLETPKSRAFSFPSYLQLFKMCAPLFIALFFFNVIENMPKFVMEGMLPYDNQLYYNALYFPAQMILIFAQLVYKPLLLRMAGVWQDSAKRRKFNLILAGIIGVIAAITAIFALIMAWVGIPVMNFLYGVDFNQYKGLMFLMLITGGITAAIDFLFQVITIMRRQKDVTVLFVMTFIFSIFIPLLLVNYAQLEGAVLSYVIVEAILFVLLSWEYFRIRRAYHGRTFVEDESGLQEVRPGTSHAPAHGRTTFVDLADPYLSEAEDIDEDIPEVEEVEPRKLLPSEKRAIRQHREDVMRRRTGGRR